MTKAAALADNGDMVKILLVEDNASMREMLASIIAEKGYAVDAAADVASGLALLKKNDYAMIVSDLQLPDMDGLSFLKKVRDLQLPFIILTAYGSIEKAVEAIKEGAYDFIAKPVDPDYLLLMIDKALAATHIARENLVLREVLQSQMGRTVIIGSSRELLHEAEKVRQVAQTQSTVLLRGESGSGKELFARAIHALSPRRDRPFITINSASIPDNLLENELFGHEKGSYTGAHMRQIGKLELAQGGTFFFDEIGDFPAAPAGQDPARAGGEVHHAPGQRQAHPAGYPLRLRHQPGPGKGRRRKALPPGPLFPHHQLPHRAAAAARPPRGHPAAGRPFRAASCRWRSASANSASRRRPARSSWPTAGRGTSASCRTPSSGR